MLHPEIFFLGDDFVSVFTFSLHYVVLKLSFVNIQTINNVWAINKHPVLS